MKILHLTTRQDWREAQERGEYRAASLDSEGFIHCSTDRQLLPVANAFYRETQDPVVLWIDTAKLAAPLRWEAPVPEDDFSTETFPHVYGPLNLDAVVLVTALKRDDDGEFIGF